MLLEKQINTQNRPLCRPNNIDAHAFKQQAGGVPRNQVSRYDIYQDTANNHQLWVGTKDGRIWRKTIYFFKDLIERWVK